MQIENFAQTFAQDMVESIHPLAICISFLMVFLLLARAERSFKEIRNSLEMLNSDIDRIDRIVAELNRKKRVQRLKADGLEVEP